MDRTLKLALAASLSAAVLVGAGCSTTTSGSGSGDSAGASSSNVATDDYTPHVSQGTPVVVDELTWRVKGPYSSQSIGDNEFSRAQANGVFVVVPVTVKNGKSKSVTLSSGQATLVAAGKQYDTDSSGEFALIGDGKKTLLLEDLGPDLSISGPLVFDVPRAALSRKPQVCFGELGFGPSRGCIALTNIKSN
jgi:hypothetical protein